MISRIAPQFTAAADFSYSATYPTGSVAQSQKASLASFQIPKDLWKRRVWFMCEEFTAAAGQLDFAGNIVFYLAGSPVCKIPVVQGANFTAWGWNPFVIAAASAASDGLYSMSSAGNSVASPAFPVTLAADKVQLEMDRFTYTAGASQLQIILAVLSEYPLV